MRQKRLSLIIAICLILVFAVLIVFMCRGCSYLLLKQIYEDVGNRNWRVVLINGFEVHQLNGKDIVLIKEDWSLHNDIVISQYINAYCYNDRYIGVWCAKDGAADLLRVNIEEDVFYIIDAQQSVLVGQYTNTEYENYCSKHNIRGLDAWIHTTPTPSEALFN